MPLSSLSSVPWMTIGLAFVAAFGVSFVMYLLLTRDPVEASERTVEGIGAFVLGAASIAMAALVQGLQFVAEIPELVIGLIGIAGIAGGWSWQGFAAIALISYIVLAAIDPDGVRR